MNSAVKKFVYIRTFGCQMNEHDSKKIRLLLEGQGYAFTDIPEDADLILYNTCTIREKAHHKAISEIGRAKAYKKAKAGVIVGVCGCVAQQDKEGLLEKYSQIDIVFGPDQIHELPRMLCEVARGKRGKAVELIDVPEEYKFLDIVGRDDECLASEFVSIMKGCNCACSYCIVPSVRGREVCRDPDDIVGEIKDLALKGTKEVVLLGQNVNAYHAKRSASQDDIDFTQLIMKISEETDISRIRFTSPHPKDMTDDLIAEFGKNHKLCPHLHLPMQSGSNATLKRMRRGYTRERYLDIVQKLRQAMPGISITTDIIVGFCGETDEEFQGTFDLMKEIGFDSIFAFKYSPRQGTYAAENMSDDVPESVKDKRLEALLGYQRNITFEKNESLIGSDQEALAYGTDRMKRGFITGRIADNRIVHFSGNEDLIGDIVRVRITAANKNSLSGEVI